MQTRIPLIRPDLGREELWEVERVLRSGIVAQGPTTRRFEEEFARYVRARHATATTSCTTALQLAVAALGLGPRDEVIVPSFTFPASSNAVIAQGATPVLADIHLDSFNLDPASVEEKITSRTRAVMPVHLFGQAADMHALSRIAREHGLRLIEDAATGLGTRHRGRHVGTFGEAGCFSFHPRKAVTTGEGGMLVTNKRSVFELAASLKDHGKSLRPPKHGLRIFSFERFGYNYRLSDLQSAVGLAQLRKLDHTLRCHQQLARRYDDLLSRLPDVVTPRVMPYTTFHPYQTYAVRLPSRPVRDRVILELRAQGVETTIGTYAVHSQPAYARAYGYKPADLPNAQRAFETSLALPLYNAMSEAQQDRVVALLRRALKSARA